MCRLYHIKTDIKEMIKLSGTSTKKERKMTKYTKSEQINKTGQTKWAFSEMLLVGFETV